MKIKNPSGEKIDFIIEGNQNSGKTLILVHGFGATKDEGANLFVDFSKDLGQYFRIIRFDFASYGESEGDQTKVNYQTQTQDLNTIIQYVKKNFPGQIFIYAHSMGCFVTAMLSPKGIDKIILGAPPSSAADLAPRFKKRILNKGGQFNQSGLTIYPRSSGDITKIGPSFWQVIKSFDEHQAIIKLAQKSKVLILKPTSDDVVGNKGFEHYKKIKNLTYKEINGDHSFTKSEGRQILIQEIKQFLLN